MSPMTKLIGLLGKKRSGKNTAAEGLGRDWTPVAFADALRDTVLRVDPQMCTGTAVESLSTVIDRLGWEDAKDTFPEVRRLLRDTGDAFRAVRPDIWVEIVLDAIAAVDGPVVVTDVRFPNEYEALLAAGARLVRVVRPGLPVDHHPSETALDDHPVHATVVNDSTVRKLQSDMGDAAAGRLDGARGTLIPRTWELWQAEPACRHIFDGRQSGYGCTRCDGWACL